MTHLTWVALQLFFDFPSLFMAQRPRLQVFSDQHPTFAVPWLRLHISRHHEIRPQSPPLTWCLNLDAIMMNRSTPRQDPVRPAGTTVAVKPQTDS